MVAGGLHSSLDILAEVATSGSYDDTDSLCGGSQAQPGIKSHLCSDIASNTESKTITGSEIPAPPHSSTPLLDQSIEGLDKQSIMSVVTNECRVLVEPLNPSGDNTSVTDNVGEPTPDTSDSMREGEPVQPPIPSVVADHQYPSTGKGKKFPFKHRILAPQMRLALTDCMASKTGLILSGTRLVLANLAGGNVKKSTPISPRPSPKPKKRYPNIELPLVPEDFPLLDHDYCFEIYSSIVCAAKKVMDKLREQKSMNESSSTAQSSTVTGNGDGEARPKKKYRTKKVIEQERLRRLSLESLAEQGDEESRKELEDMRIAEERLQSELELKRKKKYAKRKATAVPVNIIPVDKDEQVVNELVKEADRATDPVRVHDTAFQDQFLYFGTKKYVSKRRQAERDKVDPYQVFWRSGKLPNKNMLTTPTMDDHSVPAHHSLEKSKTVNPAASKVDSFPADSADTTAENVETMTPGSIHYQDMSDVLDILGISSCHSASDAEVLGNSVTRTDTDLLSLVASVSSSSTLTSPCHTCTSPLPVMGDSRSSVDSGYLEEETETIGPADGDMEMSSEVRNNNDELNHLLLTMTADQITEVINALETEEGSSGDGGSVSIASNKSTVAADDSTTTSTIPDRLELRQTCDSRSDVCTTVPTLRNLAKQVCQRCNLPAEIAENNQTNTQNSQTCNMSIDIDDADLMSTDRSINLDLLNALTLTPPKSSSGEECVPPKRDVSPLRPSESALPMVVPVTMYWNTFPALIIDDVKYVRLIDISRQALPSKETGLLKKRAQALGHEVLNCTDLQRNLLVRYAFACPSRSNLMVSETAASQVIASYMEKSEMEELSRALPTTTTQPLSKTAMTTTAAQLDPITLMPRVLVEHKPLQKSKSVIEKFTPANDISCVPERSARLRQVKRSYRRFLHMGNSASSCNQSSSKKANASDGLEPTCTGEDITSDGGYHSDRSPDSNSIQLPSPTSKPSAKLLKPSARPKGRPANKSGSTAAKKSVKKPVEKAKTLPTSGVEEAKPTPVLKGCTSQLAHLAELTDSASGKALPDTPASVEQEVSPCSQLNVVKLQHADLTVKSNGLRCSQNGDLYLEFFKSLHSLCIQCCTCRRFYALKGFIKHQHSSSSKLMAVKTRQKLEPREESIDSKEWFAFKQQRHFYESTRSPLCKLSESKIVRPPTSIAAANNNNNNDPVDSVIHSTKSAVPPNTATYIQTGKRARKQKTRNPDEIYYSVGVSPVNKKRRTAAVEF